MPVSAKRLKELNIGQMVEKNTDSNETAFTVSVDSVESTTGISAFERAITIKKILDENSKPEDFRRPGHVFPLEAKEGGVLKRAGHTEARSEEHTSELQSRQYLVCRLLLEKKK